MSGICVIPFGTHSVDQVFDLILPIQQEEFGIRITRQDQRDLENIPSFYQNGTGNFWLAMDDDKLVGTISLKDIGNQQVALRKMFVSPEYRGKEKGVAQNLLAEALSWAKKKEVAEVFLGTTSKFLAAQRFYEKNGFIEIPKSELPKDFLLMTVDSKFYRYDVAENKLRVPA